MSCDIRELCGELRHLRGRHSGRGFSAISQVVPISSPATLHRLATMETTRIEARDAALLLVNRLTLWAGAAALAAVGAFAAISAATIPGSASTTSKAASSTVSSSTSSTAQSSSSSTNSGSLQSSGTVSSATSGSGVVATGASH